MSNEASRIGKIVSSQDGVAQGLAGCGDYSFTSHESKYLIYSEKLPSNGQTGVFSYQVCFLFFFIVLFVFLTFFYYINNSIRHNSSE